ncbi:hypothetical protein IW261DRAFT_1420912 [Armillaria novae-zelandiae]|uniref:Uncharacterized protein n=1 Tax=Armillaria novae-zelandiae TaxID=153914 RepID=A0AA39U503_9AGAR|nr:hypothetical protein IW261DRAFT_1420912 [Armillaria novae-zelandiae]
MAKYHHKVELYNPYESQPEAGPSTTEYKNEAQTGPLIQSTEQRAENSWLQHGLCFTLHGILVCVHFLILLVWITRAERDATVPLGRRSSIISTAIVQVSQIIGTLYLAGIIFVSQQLGVRRNARTRQALTATSDNMAAWSGLGAALASLWRQKTLMASLLPSLLVVGYFVCIAVLNITTPAIFSLQPFNQTRNAVIATTLGKPNISVNSLVSSNPTSFWLDSTPVVPYLANSDRASKIGLENGTLYDVVSKKGGKGSVSLNATTFNVSCGYVDGASVTDSRDSGNWSIGTPYQGTATYIPVLAPNTFKWLPLYPYTLKDPWRHAVFYTSANITDSNGSNGVHISLNPPMQPGAHMDQSRKNVSDFSETVVPSIQIIGCTISLINQSAAVDAESHLLQHVSPSGVKSTSQWLSWQPEAAPANATAVSVSSQSTKIAPRAEDTVEQDRTPAITHPVRTTTPAAERTDSITSLNSHTTDPYPMPGPITTEATPTTTEAAPTSTDQYDTASFDDSVMTQRTASAWIHTTSSDSRSTKTVLSRTPRTTFSEDLQTSSSTYNGTRFVPAQDPNPKPEPPNNGGGGEENTGERKHIPTLAARQNSSPDPNNGGSSPPDTNPAPGNDGGGVEGAAPEGPEPAPPNNGGGEPKGAPAPQNSNPNPAPPSDGGASGGGDVPQFASPQDSNPKPAPPDNGGNSPQPHPHPAPQNPNPNPPPPNNNGGGTPPQNSNPGSDDSGGVGGAVPQNPNPEPASPNNRGGGGGGGAPHNPNPSPAPDGGEGDRSPQFTSPQDPNPNPNPAPPNNGGGSNSGNENSGNGGGGGGNIPGQGQGQSNSGQGGTSPQGGGGQGDGQQNSNFGAAGEPPSDNSNTTPQNSPAAQGQDTTGGQQNPPGQSNGGDGAGQNGGDTSDGTQDTGGTGGTSGQNSGAGTQGTGDTSGQGAAGESGGGDAGDNSDGTQGAGGTGGQDSGNQSSTEGMGNTTGQGPGGQNGDAESTGSDGSTSGVDGGVTDQPMSIPTSNGAEPLTAASATEAVVTVTSTAIKTTMVNATTTATAMRSSGTSATVSYYDSSDVFLGVWWELFNQAALSRFPSTDDCPGHPWQNPEVCNPFTVIEQFVLEDIGLYPVLLDSPIRSGSKVATLHDFENSLASATAASYWAALHTIGGGMKDNDPSNTANNNYKVAAAAGNATMEYPYTMMQLTINLTPLLMGQVASILLFILVWHLIGRPVRSDSGIDTVCLLQIVWFMRARPELGRIVADVDSPSVERLRKAGMMNTTLDGMGDETRPLAGGGE